MQLHEYPFDRVRVACEKFERFGTYRKSVLAERFGASIELPNLLNEISPPIAHARAFNLSIWTLAA